MPKTHTVTEGECIASVACESGFFPATIWSHPDNADLRRTRKIGTVLQPGDHVAIPDLQPKEVKAATGARHRFRRKGVPETLHLRFLDRTGAPRAGVAYTLDIDGVLREGKTDADGAMRAFIPPSATAGTLTLKDDRGRVERYRLRLGHLEPASEMTGARARLAQLGYACDDLPAALRLFQLEQGLPATGEIDTATEAKLVEVFGA